MTIEELNAIVDSGAIDEYIRVAEARQNKALSKIADQISERGGVRLIMIPSIVPAVPYIGMSCFLRMV